jgi:hypothetical protein
MSDLPYATISVSGADAFEFLQAQLAGDLRNIDAAGLCAWCNPKGRVICLFRVSRTDDTFQLTLPAELVDAVLKRLTMFRFRSKVDFTVTETSNDLLGIDGSYEDWRLQNLRTGIPEILQAQSEEFTPHMLNLDLLNAVSVQKGCYPGQEIVARTHFRGATKRRLLRFQCPGAVSVGDKVSDGERDVGEVLNALADELLAVVPLEKADQPLAIGKNALLHLPLPYF